MADGTSSVDALLKQFAGGLSAGPEGSAKPDASVAGGTGIPAATAPANVKPVTTQNGYAGVLDAFKAVGGLTPGEQGGASDEILKQIQAANAPAIQAVEQNAGLRKAIMSQPIARPVAPQLMGMPQAPDTRMKNPLNVFQNVGTVLAMMGSLFTRRPMVTAMNAASAAIKGYAEGDKDAAERAHQNWKDNLQAAIAQNDAEMQQYNLLLENTKMDYQERDAQLQAIAASNNDETMLAALRSGAPEMAFKIMDARQKSAESLTQLLVQAQQHDEQMAMEREKLAETERFHNESLGIGPGGSGNQSVDAVANMIANGQMAPLSGFVMRSPWGQQVMAKVAAINPNWTGQEYSVKQRAMTQFATGKQGDSVRSLNVAIQHLHVIDQLGQALDNKDLQTYNKLSQDYAQEFGTPAPTNFDAAKAIVGDEIVKAITGAGGALADREQAQKTISRANSWPQLLGVTQTYRRLLAGQLMGLQRQYETSTGMNNFEDFLAPETRSELEVGSPGAQYGYSAVMPDHRGIHSDDGVTWFYDDDGSPVE